LYRVNWASKASRGRGEEGSDEQKVVSYSGGCVLYTPPPPPPPPPLCCPPATITGAGRVAATAVRRQQSVWHEMQVGKRRFARAHAVHELRVHLLHLISPYLLVLIMVQQHNLGWIGCQMMVINVLMMT